jgi:hypothetical protein
MNQGTWAHFCPKGIGTFGCAVEVLKKGGEIIAVTFIADQAVPEPPMGFKYCPSAQSHHLESQFAIFWRNGDWPNGPPEHSV